jgi:hypothetical protein
VPVTDAVAAESLSLPLWAQMDDATVNGICSAIERTQAHAAAIRGQRADAMSRLASVAP